MLIHPKFRGFVCTTSHPLGCKKNIEEQISYALKNPFKGPKNALIIGASTGYGLAARIALTFGAKTNTLGVFFEKPSSKARPATSGWYNTAYFEMKALAYGYKAYSINGDAFTFETKEKTIEVIKKHFGKIDCLIYSLAAPRRTDPVTKKVYTSVLKPVLNSYTNKTVDFHTYEVFDVTIPYATEEELEHTIRVMGGDDWKLWLEALAKEDVLAEGIKTYAFSYIGPKLTYPIYRNGTVGKAKEHLEETSLKLKEFLLSYNGDALISVNKAVVTQASAAIPIVPLYLSILYKVMKEKGLHEGCIEQMVRLFKEDNKVDLQGRIRLDNYEMQEDVQREVQEIWPKVTSRNVKSLTDIEGYREDFFKLFGFKVALVDYNEDVDLNIKIPSIS